MIKTNDFSICHSYISSTQKIENINVNICTDSRLLTKNDFFLAISGENFNALNFLDKVVAVGCRYVIYSKNSENDQLVETFKKQIIFIETTDTILFLQEITNVLANKFQERGGKLIAISGSNGKTTTKEILYHLLKSVETETICTQKNNNNHIGVPLTLLQITKKTKFAIIELGSNHPGEIEVLCNICNPAIGLVTNIGDTHLEFFENQGNVFKEEGFLYTAVKNCGYNDKLFFKNNDDNFLKELPVDHFVYNFGYNGENFKFSIDKQEAIVQNNNNEYTITNKFITGKHNFYNLCVAFIIAKTIDEDNSSKYLQACRSFKPTKNRSEWINLNSSKVFLDAYNANPSSMELAVEGFVESIESEDYCLILGDMNELGDNSASFHFKLAKKLKEKGFKNFVFVGRFAEDYNAGCEGLGKTFKSTDELKDEFDLNIISKHKYVFIKGSRSLQLESLMDIT